MKKSTEKMIAKAIYITIAVTAAMAVAIPYVIYIPNFILKFWTPSSEGQFFSAMILLILIGILLLGALSIPGRWLLYQSLCLIERLTKRKS